MKTDQRDRDQCAAGMRAALALSGLSQEAFATAIGTSAPRFTTYKSGTVVPSATLFLKAARLARALDAASRSGLMSAPATAQAVSDALRVDDAEWAQKLVLQGRDHLRHALCSGSEAAGAWEAGPRTTGSPQWDGLIAVLTEHEFEATGRAAPTWAAGVRLDAPWVPEHPFLDEAEVRAGTPEFLSRANIFVAANDLVTA